MTIDIFYALLIDIRSRLKGAIPMSDRFDVLSKQAGEKRAKNINNRFLPPFFLDFTTTCSRVWAIIVHIKPIVRVQDFFSISLGNPHLKTFSSKPVLVLIKRTEAKEALNTILGNGERVFESVK